MTPEDIAAAVLNNHAIRPHWRRSGEQIAALIAEGVRMARTAQTVAAIHAMHVSNCAADLRDAIAEHERAARANGREDADDMTDERERVAGMEVADAARALLIAIGEGEK